VVVDWMMPGRDGLEVCRELRRRFNDPYVYAILLTARDQSDDVVAGLDAGADDYLVKPANVGELRARVRAAQRIIDLQRQLLEAQERLRVLAMHDALTGIWNRGAIFDALMRELDRARRQGSPLAVVMIDLDRFKRINDTHGHPVGDEVLREAAQRIRGAIRAYDFVGRYGGEEFLVVAPGLAGASAAELAERIRRAFEAHPIATSGPALPVTLSLGVAAAAPRSAVDLTSLLEAADDALYQAKSEGRNRTALRTVMG
jgi:two-component system cell cycle response regulator